MDVAMKTFVFVMLFQSLIALGYFGVKMGELGDVDLGIP